MPQIARYTETTAGGTTVVLPRAKTSAGVNLVSVPNVDTVGSINRAMSLNNIYYTPFRIESAISIAGFYAEVQAAGTGGQCRVGIYSADNDWQPSALILDAGVLDTSSTGTKSLSASASLAAGNYLIAYVTGGTTTTTFTAPRSSTAMGGFDPILGASRYVIEWRVGQTFGALPTTPPKWAAVTSSTLGLIYPIFLDWSPA